ncbi:MAG: oxidoreductase [Hyphomicrobiales bacterium]|nr:MAG: oxidoreductase [Hyphomicrobiales bacterium]
MTTHLPFSPTLFDGKSVLVTGGGRGIGHAVAAAFAQTGARVLVHVGVEARGDVAELFPDLDVDARERMSLVAGDLIGEDGPARLIDTAADRLGGLDVLINNAGTMFGRVPAETMTAEHYARVSDLNARSVVLASTRAIPLLKASGEGAIVNTTSISATTGGSPGSSIYSAAKAFVSTYTRSLARELAPDKIRVNAVSPGTIMTDFHRRYSSEEKLAATAKAIPLQRLGTPQDCVGAYLFLSASALSGYITGQVLEVNGGQLMG